MADVSCGPSNALQNFRKHTTVDRTLQQDRVVSSRQQEQGFRSVGPAAGVLDAEFHAFQASPVPDPALQRLQLPLAPFRQQANPPFQQATPDWAADFQNLNITNSVKLGAGPAEWHTAFAAAINTPQEVAQPNFLPQRQWQPQNQSFNPMLDLAYNLKPGMQNSYTNQGFMTAPQMDDAAFAQAFDQASAEIQQESTSKGKEKTIEPASFNMKFACTDPGDIMGEYDFDAAKLNLEGDRLKITELKLENAALNMELKNATAEQDYLKSKLSGLTDLSSVTRTSDMPKIGADTIAAKNESEAINQQAEADELSRTAGHLVDTLKDEKNVKFQQSSFMALMRQLRDKEVMVEGDKMVPNNPSIQTPHPGGRFYPYDAFDRAPLNSNLQSTAGNGPPVQHYYPEP